MPKAKRSPPRSHAHHVEDIALHQHHDPEKPTASVDSDSDDYDEQAHLGRLISNNDERDSDNQGGHGEAEQTLEQSHCLGTDHTQHWVRDPHAPGEMSRWLGQPSIKGSTESMRMFLLTCNTIGIS